MKKHRGLNHARSGSFNRHYYDPAKEPKPRTIEGGVALEAEQVIETRQSRRARERDQRKRERSQ